jgi:hypothetical protein
MKKRKNITRKKKRNRSKLVVVMGMFVLISIPRRVSEIL